MSLSEFEVPIYVYFDIVAKRRTWLLVQPGQPVGIGDIVAIYEFNGHSERRSGNFICRTVQGIETLPSSVVDGNQKRSLILSLGDIPPDYPF